jgi:hypothetical protein
MIAYDLRESYVDSAKYEETTTKKKKGFFNKIKSSSNRNSGNLSNKESNRNSTNNVNTDFEQYLNEALFVIAEEAPFDE